MEQEFSALHIHEDDIQYQLWHETNVLDEAFNAFMKTDLMKGEIDTIIHASMGGMIESMKEAVATEKPLEETTNQWAEKLAIDLASRVSDASKPYMMAFIRECKRASEKWIAKLIDFPECGSTERKTITSVLRFQFTGARDGNVQTIGEGVHNEKRLLKASAIQVAYFTRKLPEALAYVVEATLEAMTKKLKQMSEKQT